MKGILMVCLFVISVHSYSQIAGSLTEVYFEFDSYELNDEAKNNLDKEITQFNESSKIILIGFTDSVGANTYNLDLSLKRCETVKNYFLSKGVLSKSFEDIEGKGERIEFEDLRLNRAVSISSSTFHSMEKIVHQSIDENINIDTLPNNSVDTLILIKGSLNDEVDSVSIGETLVIDGLNFIPGRHYLMRNSEPKLYELLELLQINPSLKIEIQGHICCSRDGQDGYDFDTDSKLLSLNRAINIYEYLVKQGINRNRLSYKGFGPTKPLVEEIDELTRQMNRRVEIKIIEK